jgi:uncharacterized protein (DUF58 family)
MSRTALLSLWLYGLVLLGLATVRAEITALALPLVIYLLAGIIFQPPQPNLRVRRSLSARMAASNEAVRVAVEVLNQGQDLEQVHIFDPLPGTVRVQGSTELYARLPAGGGLRLEYEVHAGRNAYTLPPVQVRVSDFLGLIWRHEKHDPGDVLVVYPDVQRLPAIPIHPRHTRPTPGSIATRLGGAGISFFDVREYQPGDALRQINWRASARHPQVLRSNDYELERAAEVGLILDARLNSYFHSAGQDLFEFSITAAASFAHLFLQVGNRVGLAQYGLYVDWVYPGYGKRQRERILDLLARVRMGKSETNPLESLPTRFFHPGAQLIYISPLQAEDVAALIRLRARGYAILLVSPDPISFEQRGFSAQQLENPAYLSAWRIARLERRVILSSLRQAGVSILDWDTAAPLHQAALQLTQRAAFIPQFPL